MSGPTGGITSADLRALVREVLRDTLPGPAVLAVPAVPAARADDGADRPVVTIGTDEELAEFVRLVATECEDPGRREQLRDGAAGFRLAATPSPAQPLPVPAADRPVLRVERGAVTERHVREAGRTGATVVAARGVAVTPLARDRARSTGVDIEKER